MFFWGVLGDNMTARGQKVYKSRLMEGVDPWAALALAILDRARDDANGGDLAALAWLVGPGYDLAERIDPRGGGALALLRWCTTLFERLQAAQQAGERRLGYWPLEEEEPGA